jgi:hypothetical protein
MNHFVALVFFGVVVALAWKLASRQKKHRAETAAKREVRRSYHCVGVRTGCHACDAARNIGNTLFLDEEAPSLPIAGCTASTCSCTYFHRADRRESAGRISSMQDGGFPYATVGERRSRNIQREWLKTRLVRNHGIDHSVRPHQRKH